MTAFLETVQSVKADCSPLVALGKDIRLESKNMIGVALEFEDQLLHLSVFAREKNARYDAPHSQMERFARRRGYRL